tara:strand:+ start:626 stop:1483 length:858 start_codon:yes stop_codon:yes gene_type:complete
MYVIGVMFKQKPVFVLIKQIRPVYLIIIAHGRVMSMGVDVVIPTFRREKELKRCLAALEEQTVRPNSIEVVDDSESDRGPAYSRNKGLRRGVSEIVAFTDDDCVPSKTWIEDILREMADGSNAIEGGVTTVDENGEVVRMDPKPRDRWNRFKTANMAFRRDVLEEVGGFDERYFIHREDTDLAWRVLNSGYNIKWCPDCIVHHPDRFGVERFALESELLLYRCDPKKYVEIAAGTISFRTISDGTWKKLRVGMRSHQGKVKPLTRLESISLWLRATIKSISRKLM